MGNDGYDRNDIPGDHNFNPRSLVGNDCVFIFRDIVTQVYFNPRSLVGNDRYNGFMYIVFVISIHVPSWGTTDSACNTCKVSGDFNPRSLVGNDYFQVSSAYL